MEVIQNGSTPNDHLGLDTSQINDKLYIFLCGWKTHPSGHVVVFSSQFWDLSTLSLTPLTPLTHPPPPEKNSNKYIQQGTNISPSQGIYLKMIFLFPLGGICVSSLEGNKYNKDTIYTTSTWALRKKTCWKPPRNRRNSKWPVLH